MEKNKNRKRAFKVLLILILFLIILIFSSIILYLYYFEKNRTPERIVDKLKFEREEGNLFIKEVVRYPAMGNVTSFVSENNTIKLGVTTQTDELNFGVVPENLTVRKFINLKNNKKGSVKICIISYGNIKDFIKVKDGNDIILKGNETKEVEILFNATKIGNYKGEIDVIIRKPKYWVLEKFLGFIRC